MPTKMKVCNTKDYNNSLKKRGQIFHLLEKTRVFWRDTDAKGCKQSKYTYSEILINALAILRYTLKLPYRQLEGFVEDYVQLKGENLPIPDFSTLSRRMKTMEIILKNLEAQPCKNEPYDILIDSTGINIYATGGGHSKENSKARSHHLYAQVRKLHIVYEPKSQGILAIKVTGGAETDASVVPELLSGLPDGIKGLYADKAYDRIGVRKACVERKIQQKIPPTRNAAVKKSKKKDPSNLWDERNAAISYINSFAEYEEGLNHWKEKEGYGLRALVEGVFSRFKRIFGFYFMSKNEQSRTNELAVKVQIINSHSQFAKPIFVKVG